MFPADGLNREGDMDTLRSRAAEVSAGVERHAMPFCPGCRKYHREGHQFCENYPLTPAEILEQQGNAANTDPNNLRAVPLFPASGYIQHRDSLIGVLPKDSIDAILEERGKKYGKFEEHARITQAIKAAMVDSPNWNSLPQYMKEALEMDAHKTGRILNGDPFYDDSWQDKIGYTKLVLDKIHEQTTDTKKA